MFKLTNQNHETFGKTKWGEGITHTASGIGDLCTNGWIHFYKNPKLAVFFNPIHANFIDPVLWECSVDGIIKSDGTKYGCTKLTTIKIIEIPVLTTEQRIKFAILCAKEVYKEKGWNEWADKWLNGSDRTADSAKITADFAYAAYAANTTNSAYAAYATAYVAYADVNSYTVDAAAHAVVAANCLDLESLIERIP